jgi:hypothetical protein
MKRWNKHLISRRYFFCLKNLMRSRRQSFINEETKRSLRSSNDNDNLKRTSRMMTIVNVCSRSLYNDDDNNERWIERLSSLCRNSELSMKILLLHIKKISSLTLIIIFLSSFFLHSFRINFFKNSFSIFQTIQIFLI